MNESAKFAVYAVLIIFNINVTVLFWPGFLDLLVVFSPTKQSLSHLQHLVVANGGLGNGVSREDLSAALKEKGELENLVMPPHKPYAFVTYR